MPLVLGGMPRSLCHSDGSQSSVGFDGTGDENQSVAPALRCSLLGLGLHGESCTGGFRPSAYSMPLIQRTQGGYRTETKPVSTAQARANVSRRRDMPRRLFHAVLRRGSPDRASRRPAAHPRSRPTVSSHTEPRRARSGARSRCFRSASNQECKAINLRRRTAPVPIKARDAGCGTRGMDKTEGFGRGKTRHARRADGLQ